MVARLLEHLEVEDSAMFSFHLGVQVLAQNLDDSIGSAHSSRMPILLVFGVQINEVLMQILLFPVGLLATERGGHVDRGRLLLRHIKSRCSRRSCGHQLAVSFLLVLIIDIYQVDLSPWRGHIDRLPRPMPALNGAVDVRKL